jgi:hypothetical protein
MTLSRLDLLTAIINPSNIIGSPQDTQEESRYKPGGKGVDTMGADKRWDHKGMEQ